MENKVYADQSTAFDHMNGECKMYEMNKPSETLIFRNMVSAFTLDCVLILGILIIAFYIV